MRKLRKRAESWGGLRGGCVVCVAGAGMGNTSVVFIFPTVAVAYFQILMMPIFIYCKMIHPFIYSPKILTALQGTRSWSYKGDKTKIPAHQELTALCMVGERDELNILIIVQCTLS